MSEMLTASLQQRILSHVNVVAEPECIVLAVSHSLDFAGRLRQAGASHVICTSGAVKNATMLVFTEKFYSQIFTKSKSLCQAYRDAIWTMQVHVDRTVSQGSLSFRMLCGCNK